MPFSNYIIRVPLPKWFKPPFDLEPYDRSTNPQEHMDAFKTRMIVTKASNIVKCRAFLITLKKVALKWFNSLPSRSINRFPDLSSRFLAHFTTRRFKLKLVSSLLGISQQQGESLLDFLKRYNAETLLVEELET